MNTGAERGNAMTDSFQMTLNKNESLDESSLSSLGDIASRLQLTALNTVSFVDDKHYDAIAFGQVTCEV